MGKIFLWISHVSYQLSCDICGGIVMRHSGLVCGHNGTLAGEATLGVTVAADRSGRFKSAVWSCVMHLMPNVFIQVVIFTKKKNLGSQIMERKHARTEKSRSNQLTFSGQRLWKRNISPLVANRKDHKSLSHSYSFLSTSLSIFLGSLHFLWLILVN